MTGSSRTIAIAALISVVAGGCAGRRPAGQGTSAGEIRAINVMTVPVALNLDQKPGPDGFSVKVYANDATHPKPVPLKEGRLEILMFDGSFYGKTEVPPPLKTWSYSAEELRAHRFDAGIGTGYEFVMAWGQSVPQQRMITVAARYTSDDQRVVTSRPSSVTVANR